MGRYLSIVHTLSLCWSVARLLGSLLTTQVTLGFFFWLTGGRTQSGRAAAPPEPGRARERRSRKPGDGTRRGEQPERQLFPKWGLPHLAQVERAGVSGAQEHPAAVGRVLLADSPVLPVWLPWY